MVFLVVESGICCCCNPDESPGSPSVLFACWCHPSTSSAGQTSQRNRLFLRGYRDTCPTVAKRHRSAVDFISGSCSCNSTTSPITVASLFQTPSWSHESDTKTVRLCTNNETNWVFTSFKRNHHFICLSLSSFLMRQHIKIMKQSCLKTQKILYCMIPACGISCYKHLWYLKATAPVWRQ